MEILIKKVHFLVFFILSVNLGICSSKLKKIIFLEEPGFYRSDILCFKTSFGLFQISSIDYKNKLLTISHTSCSSLSNYVSLKDLSLGFPPPPKPNSLLLFNCLNSMANTPALKDCSHMKNEKDSSLNLCKGLTKKGSFSFSCLMVDDVQDLGNGFHPKELNCSHYRRVYKSNTSQDENSVKFEFGTRLSWEIDHVPNPCDECRKPHCNCGVGLRCLCLLSECKIATMLFSLLFLIVLLDYLEGV
ncbi:unnamed protein product [Withania somnifera]